MATKKPTKKTTTSKPKQRARATSTAQKKKSVSSSTARPSKVVRYVRLRRDDESFMTFRVNRETFYWLVLGVVIIGFTMWIMHLQNEIQTIYDQIDANIAAEASMPIDVE